MPFINNICMSGSRIDETHEVFEEAFLKDNYVPLEELIKEKDGEELTMVKIANEQLQFEVDFRYFPRTATYSVKGHLTLSDSNPVATPFNERMFNDAYGLMLDDIVEKLNQENMPAEKSEDELALGGGRTIWGNGSTRVYKSNQYDFNSGEIEEQAELIVEEMATALYSLAHIYDGLNHNLNISVGVLSDRISMYVWDKIKTSKDLIEKYKDSEATEFCRLPKELWLEADSKMGF